LKISINSNILTLNHFSDLESYHFGAIEFIGFIKKSDDSFVLEPDNLNAKLVELIDYLSYENIDYEMCEICSGFLEKHQKIIDEFDDLKYEALNFKNENFNTEDYKLFQESISGLISRPLKSHQKKAAYHLYKIGNGANFSVPGSGKTSVVLSVYEKLKSEGKVNALFVVGPLASFGPWKTEFELVLGRKPRHKVLAGGSLEKRRINYLDTAANKSELYLTSFQTLLFDAKDVRQLFSQKGINFFFIIDEAHYIKRLDGQWASAVLGLSSLSDYRCILTGTPIPKSYTDTFNLFDFLWPNNNAIDDDSKIRIRSLENSGSHIQAAEIVKDKINPLYYRVRKSELGLKEQIFKEPIGIEMNPLEKRVYKAIENKIENYSKTDYINNIEFVSRLYRGRMIRLRQAVSNVGLIKNSINDYSEDVLSENSDIKKIVDQYDTLEVPSKIKELIRLTAKLRKENKKVVIWSNFIGSLDLIKKHLVENNFNCKLIFGGTPIEQDTESSANTREQIRNEFVDKNSGLDILVANPAACAESISLHKTCQDAIYYDLSYNCAQYLQSLDRIHRVGGSELRPSNYYFLQYKNTIDVDILENINRKAQKMYDVIEEDFGIYSLDMFDENDDTEAYMRLFKNK